MSVLSKKLMKFIDFFAGIGGFRKGMELAGHECVGFCEYSKFATASYTSMHLITEEQRRYLGQMPLKQRQKEILKEEYRNGEWYAEDIRLVKSEEIPSADCWCAGFPCQDISIAGKQLGFSGNRSSLYFQIIRLLKSQKEEDRPQWIFLENVKNLLSVNGGWDFARVLAALDEVGYDCQWKVLNSKNFGVPQNRERVFVVGCLRTQSGRKVFSVRGESIGTLKQVIGGSQAYRVYDPAGISSSLIANGGGKGAKTGLYCVGNINPSGHGISGNVYHSAGLAPTLTTNRGMGYNVFVGSQHGITEARAILTPNRQNKRQNGRRIKDNNEPMFTLTGQDRHGVYIRGQNTDNYFDIEAPIRSGTKQGYDLAHSGDGIYLPYPQSNTHRGKVCKGCSQTLDTGCRVGTLSKHGRIRHLTPRECFRLQGWGDEYFERAEFVSSENQLYMQAGNGVTVPVIQTIAESMF